MLQRLGGHEVEVVGGFVQQEQCRAAEFEQEDLVRARCPPDSESNSCSAAPASS
ncbi:hypothetical protein H5I60_04010 [Streptomyces griseolus]|nr:hypothetical protein [Streptomyces griseolus]